MYKGWYYRGRECAWGKRQYKEQSNIWNRIVVGREKAEAKGKKETDED